MHLRSQWASCRMTMTIENILMWPPHGISPVPQYRKVSNSPFFPVSYISVPCILHSQCRNYKNHIAKVGSGWYYQHGEVMGADGGVKNFLALFISLLLFWCFNKSCREGISRKHTPIVKIVSIISRCPWFTYGLVKPLPLVPIVMSF